jgi:hemoglobin
LDELEVYSMIGTEGFTRLVGLRDFLIYRFGGPPSYIEQRGHPRLRARHAMFLIDPAARDRWMQLMGNALAKAALPPEAEQGLRNFLEATATSMINQVEAG